MMNLEQIDRHLQNIMSKERYQHSIQVSSLAEKISDYYHIPSVKAKLLGLIHDCAKDYSLEKLKRFMKKYQICLDQVEKHIPGIWHAYVGAEIARNQYKVNDPEMLDAIRYHSTGSGKLGLLGKIVYIADKIEPGRQLEHVDQARILVWQDIDRAMLELLNQEINLLISRNLVIHPDTIQARNKILIENNTGEHDGKVREAQ